MTAVTTCVRFLGIDPAGHHWIRFQLLSEDQDLSEELMDLSMIAQGYDFNLLGELPGKDIRIIVLPPGFFDLRQHIQRGYVLLEYLEVFAVAEIYLCPCSSSRRKQRIRMSGLWR